MRETLALTRRNSKLFFKDRGMFFSALITPLILLVLYATFLANVCLPRQLCLRHARRGIRAGHAAGRNGRRAAHLVAAGRMLRDGVVLLKHDDGTG